MANNPYAPPGSNVADPPINAPGERPRIVVIAVRLLWGSFLAGVPGMIYGLFTPPPGMSVVLNIVSTLIAALFSFAIAYLLFTPAWRGRNWSRIVQAVLLPLGILAIYFISTAAPELLEAPAYIEITYLIQTLMNAFGVAMLFAPSANAWYRAMRRH